LSGLLFIFIWLARLYPKQLHTCKSVGRLLKAKVPAKGDVALLYAPGYFDKVAA